MACRDPADRKKRRMNAGAGEQAENAIDIRLDPGCKTVPIGASDTMREGLNLEIVLDVNSHRVGTGRRLARRHQVLSTAAASSLTIRWKIRSCRADTSSSNSIRCSRSFDAPANGDPESDDP